MLDSGWFQRQERANLYQLARGENETLELEAGCLADLGDALSDLAGKDSASLDGLGVLLKGYAAVAEIHTHLVHNALAELQRRDREGAPC
jgi:hypothetical protein